MHKTKQKQKCCPHRQEILSSLGLKSSAGVLFGNSTIQYMVVRRTCCCRPDFRSLLQILNMSQSSKKSSAKLSSDVMATVTALFLEMDSDCNGWLSREELHEGLSRLGFRLSDTTAEVIKTVCLSVSNPSSYISSQYLPLSLYVYWFFCVRPSHRPSLCLSDLSVPLPFSLPVHQKSYSVSVRLSCLHSLRLMFTLSPHFSLCLPVCLNSVRTSSL